MEEELSGYIPLTEDEKLLAEYYAQFENPLLGANVTAKQNTPIGLLTGTVGANYDVVPNVVNPYAEANLYGDGYNVRAAMDDYVKTLSAGTGNGYINAWELNTFSVNPYRLYNYGQNNGAINTSFAVGNNTLQLYGIFNLAYSNQNNGLPFYTNLTPLSQVYLEYIPSNFYFTLYVKNQVSYFNSTEVPNNTQPFDEQVNFNLEMLNNGGGYVSYPASQGVTANYSTKMLPNITRTFI